ncbi:hypothetical protein PoB_004325800 [Plakobranchus ocellatus]|uniref:Uncharacterized protein n=1 Tax=Plakobranchus ocellatus TaxID=259542 RepID=A0AAV4BCY0_9GAST|nr:hypothetical protein PoB_004325800 [Plakobranchus ocellatus]
MLAPNPIEEDAVYQRGDAPKDRYLGGNSLASLLGFSDGIRNLERMQTKLSLPRGGFPHSSPPFQPASIPLSPLSSANHGMVNFPTSYIMDIFRDALYERGVSEEEVEKLMLEISQSILLPRLALDLDSNPGDVAAPSNSALSKRGYSHRAPVHTRFAPKFGTKLVPNEQMDDGGSTLLRYGRSTGVGNENKH